MSCQDDSYQFKDIKQLIMGMLDKYNYEEVSTTRPGGGLSVPVQFW